ncbi:hypothetical protein EVAR_95683_1 [Eumeta japonica]|uniref:Uncharacterized protein n=1 Tax=Eumeta variegata TaxID=151549 RepID=A0A4C1VK11_EUMVA|nr:hypothetical protein EVAR_95683_1 [Eumeta japonica]
MSGNTLPLRLPVSMGGGDHSDGSHASSPLQAHIKKGTNPKSFGRLTRYRIIGQWFSVCDFVVNTTTEREKSIAPPHDAGREVIFRPGRPRGRGAATNTKCSFSPRDGRAHRGHASPFDASSRNVDGALSIPVMAFG